MEILANVVSIYISQNCLASVASLASQQKYLKKYMGSDPDSTFLSMSVWPIKIHRIALGT